MITEILYKDEIVWLGFHDKQTDSKIVDELIEYSSYRGFKIRVEQAKVNKEYIESLTNVLPKTIKELKKYNNVCYYIRVDNDTDRSLKTSYFNCSNVTFNTQTEKITNLNQAINEAKKHIDYFLEMGYYA